MTVNTAIWKPTVAPTHSTNAASPLKAIVGTNAGRRPVITASVIKNSISVVRPIEARCVGK